MYILAIESSCDETSMSIIKDGVEEICTVTNTQIDIQKQFGGVVPEVASRSHIENVTIVLDELFQRSNMTMDDIVACQQKWIKGRTYIYGILGDANDLDMNYLKSLGTVQQISLDELFGYK